MRSGFSLANAFEQRIREIAEAPAILRKRAAGKVVRRLADVVDFGRTVAGPGDDAAALRKVGAGGYLLLAADSVLPSLVERWPKEAGRAAVLVNANDVYAMGGRPVAMVNVLAGLTEEQQEEVCAGMRLECRRLGVPMVGGHVSPEAKEPFVAVSILGEAQSLLEDRRAGPGEKILLALDLRGKRWGDRILNWDSHEGKDSETLQADLSVLCSLAEEGLCTAARDVSNAGIAGTLALLLERAGLGAEVFLDRIAVPEGFDLFEWLQTYPSYGFLLLSRPGRQTAVLDRFEERGIWAAEIGVTDSSRIMRLRLAEHEAVFIDFQREGILSSPGES